MGSRAARPRDGRSGSSRTCTRPSARPPFPAKSDARLRSARVPLARTTDLPALKGAKIGAVFADSQAKPAALRAIEKTNEKVTIRAPRQLKIRFTGYFSLEGCADRRNRRQRTHRHSERPGEQTGRDGGNVGEVHRDVALLFYVAQHDPSSISACSKLNYLLVIRQPVQVPGLRRAVRAGSAGRSGD